MQGDIKMFGGHVSNISIKFHYLQETSSFIHSFFNGSTVLVGQGLLFDVSRSHTQTLYTR